MCGIVGTVRTNTNEPVSEDSLWGMLGAVRHRGPDEFGIYTWQGENSTKGGIAVGLGNARLSIIDLAGGQQPISNEDGSVWIVFNGEIFNYQELRPQLERQGHHFHTQSDTEVIVHLYETYGPDCVQRLNGQFAFAIWDERSRRLFAARDRVGIRPFFYSQQGGAFQFASEIKALLAGGVRAEFDLVTLGQIFTYWSPLAPRTPFQDIFTLPPGHWLMLDENGRLQRQRYWQPDFTPMTVPPPLPEAAAELRRKLADATRIRLRADVPVGAYLSGGLDSSAIAALIRQSNSSRLETFSIAFTDGAFDESEFQQTAVRHLGTRHHTITCTHADIGRVFPDVIWHTEMPILRTSPAPLFLLSQLVGEHNFKVVLTGEGADEFLGGYNIFKEAMIRHFWARRPSSTLRPALLKKLYPYIASLNNGNDAYLRRFFGQKLDTPDSSDFSHIIRWGNTRRTQRIFTPEVQAATGEPVLPAIPDGFGGWPPLARAQFLEISVFMAEYLLSSQGDRMAMAHSIEGRFPFLDHRVIEFANQLPATYKLRGLNEKFILKKAAVDLLPTEIWNRPKRPYRAPIHRSFFPDGRPLDWVADLLNPDHITQSGLFRPTAVAALQKKIARIGHLSETDDMMLAGLLSTLLVQRQFITHFQPPPPVDGRDPVKVVHRTEPEVET